MNFIDSHTHLYEPRFDADRKEMLQRAVDAGVTRMLLPGVDSESHDALIALAKSHPGHCFAMMGMHPTSANETPDYQTELSLVERLLAEAPVPFYAVGETGLDLHWSRDFLREQQEAFRFQIELALKFDLPLVIHTREAFAETLAVLSEYRSRGLRGVFHCFSGTAQEYRVLRGLGDFRFGIAGMVTYKNASLAAVVAEMELADLVLETDAPYLPPVPHRGQRNESAYIPLIAAKVAEIKGIPLEKVARETTKNTERLFFG